MSHIDWLELDGKLLHLLLTVLETGSVTVAAQKLGVTQSAVSHGLERLRAIAGDPLFVKSGRGIVPTTRAQELAAPARALLSGMERFAHSGDFDPAQWESLITIAANDLQRDLLLPALATRLRTQAPGLRLRVIPSDVPSADLLRSDACQLAISPRPPDASDVLQKRLFDDEYRVFYDATVRKPPKDLSAYCSALHATVEYGPHLSLDLDQQLRSNGVVRHFALSVTHMGALAAFVHGTALLATMPSLLARHSFRGLASCAPPVACPRLPMYALWHKRYRDDAAHRWLRGQLDAVVAQTLKTQHHCPER